MLVDSKITTKKGHVGGEDVGFLVALWAVPASINTTTGWTIKLSIADNDKANTKPLPVDDICYI